MFVLQVHSVDTEHPLETEERDFLPVAGFTRSEGSTSCGPKLVERRGLVHLYRNVSQTSLPNSGSRSTSLFVVAVPNYLSSSDFIRFCGSLMDQVSELIFIRNDGTEDRYSVIVKLVDQPGANKFYCSLNGKRFSPAEAEACHILFALSVAYTESSEIASNPPEGFTELPTCPICLERFDPDTSGILSTLCDHSFQCSCTSKWTYLSCQVCRLCQQQDEIVCCSICGKTENLWACMICSFLGCGRYKEGHAVKHWKNTQHFYSLDLRTQQIWDYVGDGYVHRLNQSKADGKLVDMSTRCASHEVDCGSCGCREDAGISRALYNSKVDAIVIEYNDLLASQLKAQRRYYESLLSEARSKQETSTVEEVVEKAVMSKMQEIQNQLEKFEEEKKSVAKVNRKLIAEQETWKKKVTEIKERRVATVRLLDQKMRDLEEQIRDVTVYVEAQKTLGSRSDSDDFHNGTVLAVAPKESPSSSRRQKKSSRRRS